MSETKSCTNCANFWVNSGVPRCTLAHKPPIVSNQEHFIERYRIDSYVDKLVTICGSFEEGKGPRTGDDAEDSQLSLEDLAKIERLFAREQEDIARHSGRQIGSSLEERVGLQTRRAILDARARAADLKFQAIMAEEKAAKHRAEEQRLAIEQAKAQASAKSTFTQWGAWS